MSILNADNLAISFGAFDLFRGISVSVPNNAKIGLIGPNGVGKTSLLLLLAGINAPTSGKVHLARGRRFGYLRQEAVEAFADCDNSLYAEMLTVFSDFSDQQEKLYALEAQMAEDFNDTLLKAYGKLQEHFERRGGYDYELCIRKTLSGLGLSVATWEIPLRQLSGGQKTRALLARLLLEKPDMLMLDEPTNHLDIEAVEWLERTLREWEGAVLVVSHDRYFLDNVVQEIWEMSRSGIRDFSGNYSAYLLQRQEQWEYYERIFSEEKARLLNEVDFIQRNWVRASTHARALGRLRQISRDLAIVENFGILALRDGRKWSEFRLNSDRPLDVIEAVRAVNAIHMDQARPPVIKPRLPSAPASGNIVLRAEQTDIGFPRYHLFHIDSLELRRGECAGLVGPNGSGKTTFLKVLLGELQPTDGEVRLGAGLKIGYFAQAHDTLNGEHSVVEELIRHKEMLVSEARNYLAPYQFRDEDVFKPLSALSGGERARLALAILALDGANLLLLDEPTNHLDIPAREALQELMESFKGTILLVSHDRYLIDCLATQIWELQDRKLLVFKGNYRDYVLRGVTAPAVGSRSKTILPTKPMVRDNSKETRRRQEELEKLEERIRHQEAVLQCLSRKLQGIATKQQEGEKQPFDRVRDLSWQVSKTQAALEELMVQWERLAG